MANYYYMGGRYVANPGRWSPTLYKVDVSPDIEFDDELFYFLDANGAGSIFLRKCTVSSGSGITITTSYNFPNEAETTSALNGDSACVHVLGSGNVLVSGHNTSGDDWIGLWLFDEDLTLLNSIEISVAAGVVNDSLNEVYVDELDNIYIPRTNGNSEIRVLKYNSGLSLVWTSDQCTLNGSAFYRGGNVLKNYVLMIVSGSTSDNSVANFFNKQTGALEKTITDSFFRSGGTVWNVGNFTDGRFFCAIGGSAGDNGIRIYDEDATLSVQKLEADLGETMEEVQIIGGANQDDTFFVAVDDTDFVQYDDTITQVWKYNSIVATETLQKMGWTTDRSILRLYTRNGSNRGTIQEVDTTGQTISEIGDFSTAGITAKSRQAFAMKVANWQLRVDQEGIIYEVTE